MRNVVDLVRSRLLPALLTALGVVLVTAGLLSYADPTTAGTGPSPSGIGELGDDPGPSFSFELPSDEPPLSPEPPASLDPSPSGNPSPSTSGRQVATRVVVPALNIDLPIIKGSDRYPYCNVAMYLTTSSKASRDAFGQPGEGRATYLYAHARTGMFFPIYRLAIQRGTPDKMVGMLVQVYTSDDRLYLYEVTSVRLHVTTLDPAIASRKEQVWLQTSEGPKGTKGKTQVIASFVSVTEASSADAKPKPKPVACG
jgi:Sortase domain